MSELQSQTVKDIWANRSLAERIAHAKKMNSARNKKMRPYQRSLLAQHAVRKRWQAYYKAHPKTTD